jgi:hypothetical protein
VEMAIGKRIYAMRYALCAMPYVGFGLRNGTQEQLKNEGG